MGVRSDTENPKNDSPAMDRMLREIRVETANES